MLVTVHCAPEARPMAPMPGASVAESRETRHHGGVSIFDRRPHLRWAVPAAAGALILAGTVAGTVGASADAGLPPKTAEALLVELQAPQATALSGTIVATADLGLPELPTGMGSSAELSSLVSGSHTLRVWSDGPERTRLAMIGTAQESDVVRNGRDVWMWSSTNDTADHYVLPERDTSAVSPLPADLPRTPQEAAALVLASLDGTTGVSTSGVDQVAGRPVYELILTPKQTDTLVARVVMAMDAETRIPLRVQVFSTAMSDPAYEVGFTSVDFSTPEARLFEFTPPPGATVTEHAAPSKEAMAAGSGTKPGAGASPTVVGSGWSQVVIAAMPVDEAAGLAGATVGGNGGEMASSGGLDAAALLESLPRTSGTWGSGRVLNGTLFSAILTDDGRIAIGAVTPQTLGAALAAQ